MELATRIFDVVTDENNLRKGLVEDLVRSEHHKRDLWKRTVRLAALSHDWGHLPFSHAAEDELLESGKSHEHLTVELILAEKHKGIWQSAGVEPRLVAKLAVGQKKFPSEYAEQWSPWESILSEIITGDAFGADRMDYLLRDSFHCGVAYGHFDHHRLIDSLRILPKDEESELVELGIDEDGIFAAGALAVARYSMFNQVYFHRIRRMYDIHLKEFLKDWLTSRGMVPLTAEHVLTLTDSDVLNAIALAAKEKSSPGHHSARIIQEHKHFKLLYQRNRRDHRKNPEAAREVFEKACEAFGDANFRWDPLEKDSGKFQYPVRFHDGSVDGYVEPITDLPMQQNLGFNFEYVFASRDVFKEASKWLEGEKGSIIHRFSGPGEEVRDREGEATSASASD
jgi:uncharacterized protein